MRVLFIKNSQSINYLIKTSDFIYPRLYIYFLVIQPIKN